MIFDMMFSVFAGRRPRLMTIFGELFDRQFYVAAQRFGQTLHLDLLALLGRVGVG